MSETMELYRCTECGKLSVSIGWLHAHVETHRGYTPLNIQLPFSRTSPGDFDVLMEYTDVLEVAVVDTHEEPRDVEFRTPIRCRLFGHDWEIEPPWDEGDRLERPTCERCGQRPDRISIVRDNGGERADD